MCGLAREFVGVVLSRFDHLELRFPSVVGGLLKLALGALAIDGS